MTRKQQASLKSGYYGVGIYLPKTEQNVGVLMRSAFLYQAAFVFTVGRRYHRVASDTPDTTAQIPTFHFQTVEEALYQLPVRSTLVGVELDDRAVSLDDYTHPLRATYLLGAEDSGLPPHVLELCADVVQIPTPIPVSMNVSAAGSILLHDRYRKARG